MGQRCTQLTHLVSDQCSRVALNMLTHRVKPTVLSAMQRREAPIPYADAFINTKLSHHNRNNSLFS